MRGGWRNSSITPTTPPSTTWGRRRAPSSCFASISRSRIPDTGPRSSGRSSSSSTSQYPSGGWPQRWPNDPNYPAYQSYITFNDDVAAENVKFLTLVYRHLGDTRALDAIRRGMNIYLLTQQGAPQAGWALQYTLDLKPAAARSYEPNALHTATTASNVEQLMDFYRMTGDRRFLARIPEALAWLESVRLPRAAPGAQLPDLRRDRHQPRRSTSTAAARTSSTANIIGTTARKRRSAIIPPSANVDVAKLRRQYEALLATSPDELAKSSPLLAPDPPPLPRYFVSGGLTGSDLNAGQRGASPAELDPRA